MRFPQVADRMKAAPLQALRAMFAGIGRLLLAADRSRSHARSQGREPSRGGRDPDGPWRGHRRPGEPGRAAPPARQRGTAAAEAAALAAAAAEEARRRSLDHSGNVRLLTAEDPADGDTSAGRDAAVAEAAGPPSGAAEPSRGDAPADVAMPADVAVLADHTWPADVTGPADVPGPADVTAPGDVTGPADVTAPGDVTLPGDVSLPADLTAAGPAEARVLSPAFDAPADVPAPRPVPSVAASLPLANYDALSLPSLRARLRNLDSAQLRVLLDYEMSHAGREAIMTMFLRRIVKLDSGQG